MKERPILSSGPMVRAILDGKKTQTRRVVRNPEEPPKHWNYQELCPYGVAGDRLYVKERHTFVADEFGLRAGVAFTDSSIQWHGDCPQLNGKTVYNAGNPDVWKWKPSIHMPRWASRITLEIVSVRCQYLQEISEADARAEAADWDGAIDADGYDTTTECPRTHWIGFRHRFWRLWDSINGKREGCSWQDNPLVWVIEFRRVSE